MIDSIADMLIVLLRGLESFTGSYGLAIVLFAVIIKLLLYYPTYEGHAEDSARAAKAAGALQG